MNLKDLQSKLAKQRSSKKGMMIDREVRPTMRQREALKQFMLNPRNKGEALRKAGYSPNTAIDPSNVINSKGFQQLLEEELPDDYLLGKHKRLLDKMETLIVKNRKGVSKKIRTEEIDAIAVSRGLDLAYKLKKKVEEAPAIKVIITDRHGEEHPVAPQLQSENLSEELRERAS